jgi:hypothetical protein
MTLLLVQHVKNLGTCCSWEEIDFAGPSTDDTGNRVHWQQKYGRPTPRTPTVT